MLRAGLLAVAAATAGCAYRSIPGFDYAPPAFVLARPGLPGRVVLLATVHAGLARFYPLPEPIERAFDAATRLIVEIDTEGRSAEIRAAATARALLPDGATLDTVLRPETLRALRRVLHQQPWTLRGLRRLQPWALALLLPDPDDERFGADPRDGVELHLIRRARARGLPIVEMETAEVQVAAFAGGPIDEQDAALALRLGHREAQSRTYVRIVDAWRRGDLEALGALKDFAYPPQAPLATLRRRLFADRDAGLADALADALEAPGPALALVGALHLAGPDALQQALERRGVVLQRLGAPAGPG